jgi:uncharacterized membrane protein SirB2
MMTQALSPNTPWLQLKLWLTVGYIVLSLVTVRTANKALRWVTGTGVLLCLLGMVGLVYGKSLPW